MTTGLLLGLASVGGGSAKSCSNQNPQQRPVFLWRGLLIILPVVVLAAAGFVSLRQDRRLVEHEAIERAQDLADGLVPGLWHTLMITRESELPAFTIGASGDTSFPPSFPPVLSPLQLEGDSLSSAQRQQWLAARALDAGLGDSAASTASWQGFLASSPPSNYVAAAHYALGLGLLEAGQKTAATENYSSSAPNSFRVPSARRGCRSSRLRSSNC